MGIQHLVFAFIGIEGYWLHTEQLLIAQEH